jgi:DNA-binding IclR family transcriptional regulator
MDENTSNPIVDASKTTLEIIQAINDLDGGSLNEISEYLNKSPSTVYRHLNTLLNEEFIVKKSNKYQLGMRFLMLGGSVQNSKPVYRLAGNKVEELADQTGERSQFVVEEYGYRVYVHTATGEQAVRTDSHIGKHGPIHCSAAGKAILANLPTEYLEDVVQGRGLPSQTENTITDYDKLKNELNKIRNNGIALNFEESIEGLNAVATPVNRPDGSIIGALSVSGPAHRLTKDRLESEIAELLLGITNELELKIEYNL